MVIFAPGADQPIHDVGDVLGDILPIGQGKMRHERLTRGFLVHPLQHPEVHVRCGFQHLKAIGFTGQVNNLPAFGREKTKNMVGDVTVDIQGSNACRRQGAVIAASAG